uniref:Homeobox domain-containing protein n=1 Tax=Mus spicilegus TaxID=10103 RepID=A0A8C6G6Q1_MUSSI
TNFTSFFCLVWNTKYLSFSLHRKELAELLNVDEQKIKDWFNNKRAKCRKIQREILGGKNITPTQEELRMKTLVESKKIIIFQEQEGDGLFWEHQNIDTQNSPLSLLFS